MANKTLHPNTIQQTIGENYATWNNLKNLKTGEYFATAYTYGASAPLEHLPNTPSKLILTNFKTEIPQNSKITSIQVSYRQMLTTTMTTLPDIGAPVFTILNLNGASQTGTAPTTTPTTNTVTFNISEMPVDAVNNGNFGVEIAYPTNENEYSGWVGLTDVKITITYTVATYSIKANNTGSYYSETVYHEDIVPITFTVTETQSVGYDPTITIQLDDNMASMFLTADGDGTMTIEGWNLYWKIQQIF